MNAAKKHLLLILDGYGIATDTSVSAIQQANTPFLDSLFSTYPHATLEASGLSVGLPDGQMGNSEVGHMNLGAGRVVYQDITRIDKAIQDGSFFENQVLRDAVEHAATNESKIHFLGCFSDGGVHSTLTHLYGLLQLCKNQGLKDGQVCVHAFTDGRDTSPTGGLKYARAFNREAERIGIGAIASVVGRYYAMDRDKRWERTKLAYDLLTGTDSVLTFDSVEEAIQASYDEEVTDEFIMPRRIHNDAISSYSKSGALIEPNDAIVFFNFRADRARQLTHAFTQDSFDGFNRERLANLHYAMFTPYEATLDLPIVFPKVNLQQTLGEVIASKGGTQLRAAETEKYPHVTFFFSGGREKEFEDEDRILVPSPKVPTYDLQPEMSAPELSKRVAEAMAETAYNLVVLNFANPDMVGHTGVFEAAVKAVEAVDKATKVVVNSAMANGYSVSIIADHGNADKMKNPDGSPHTAHTTNLVPHLIIKEGFNGPIKDGKLGDIAPTILSMLDESIPEEMDGDVLI